MSIRNRELSQFGSFIYIDDSTKTVGIATTATPYVGIGTTNATHKLTVVGDTNITGVISATRYFGDGSALSNVLALVVDGWIFNSAGIHTLSNVGIGTTNPTQKLTVDGNISATGTITGSNISLTGFEVSSGVVTASRFNSTVATGTPPLTVSSTTLVSNLNADYLRGKTPPNGDIVGTTDSQVLTNKTLTSPVISSIVNGGVLTLPTTTGTLVSTGSTGVVTSNMIADLDITNTDIAVGAAISYSKLNLTNSITNADIAVGAAISISKLAASTISGVSLGSTLNNLTAGSYINFNSGTTYNGSTARTVSVAATNINTAHTVVARNGSGDFSAGTIDCANLDATFAVDANEFKINGTTVIDSGRNARIVLSDYTEKINALGNTGVAATVNLANGNFVTATLTNNCTFTFTTGIGTGAQTFTLFLTNDATPSRTITWPVTVKWPNGTAPVRTETANKTDVYSFFTYDNGTNWYGILSIYNYS